MSRKELKCSNHSFDRMLRTYLLIIGSIKSYGILYTEFDEYYDVGSGPVAIIGSLLIGIMFAFGKHFIRWIVSLRFYCPFNSISVTKSQWKVDKERLCAVRSRL